MKHSWISIRLMNDKIVLMLVFKDGSLARIRLMRRISCHNLTLSVRCINTRMRSKNTRIKLEYAAKLDISRVLRLSDDWNFFSDVALENIFWEAILGRQTPTDKRVECARGLMSLRGERRQNIGRAILREKKSNYGSQPPLALGQSSGTVTTESEGVVINYK